MLLRALAFLLPPPLSSSWSSPLSPPSFPRLAPAGDGAAAGLRRQGPDRQSWLEPYEERVSSKSPVSLGSFG